MGQKSLDNSEAHIGSVGGHIELINIKGVTLGVDGAAYIAGDVMGDQSPVEVPLVTRVPNGTGILHSLVVKDKSKQSGDLDIILFSSRPLATTFTDNAAMDIADADMDRVIGTIPIRTTDYVAFANSSVATVRGLNLLIQPLDSRSLWFAIRVGGGYTYVADEVSVLFSFLID